MCVCVCVCFTYTFYVWSFLHDQNITWCQKGIVIFDDFESKYIQTMNFNVTGTYANSVDA